MRGNVEAYYAIGTHRRAAPTGLDRLDAVVLSRPTENEEEAPGVKMTGQQQC
jgi:hypothetical protein